MIDDYPPEPPPSPRSSERVRRDRNRGDRAGLEPDQLLELYRLLIETRRLEETLVRLHRQGHIPSGVYRSLGQEATAVGCAYAMKDGDLIQPLIRDVGAMLTHGVTPLALLRQYLARVTSPTAGRDLNNHFSDPERGILGPISMLGAMIPVLAGCLFADRARGRRHVAGLAFIGDGGSSTGAFYEGLNFAAIHELPLIVVLENNGIAFSTALESQVPNGDLLRRARGFGVWVSRVDGNDVLACYSATRAARERGGVTVIVAETFRASGHAEHDDQRTVSHEIRQSWADNDPIDRFTEFLSSGEHVPARELARVGREVAAEMTRWRDQAIEEPSPDPSTQRHGVYARNSTPIPCSATWWRGPPPGRERDS
ncbi:MAG: thiamine pyrophosphate-dependent dehydrogenase E1 component subunit alpha [Myxococcota bacterium]